MSKHRNWTVRGFNANLQYTPSTSVQLATVGTATTVEVPLERKAVEMLLVHDTLKTMSPVHMNEVITDPVVGYNVVVQIPVTEYSELRTKRKYIIAAVHQWAEKSRVYGSRGFRANAIKDPVIAKNKDGNYSLKFNVLFSNAIFYTSKVHKVGAIHDSHAISDFEVLRVMLNAVIRKPLNVVFKAA